MKLTFEAPEVGAPAAGQTKLLPTCYLLPRSSYLLPEPGSTFCYLPQVAESAACQAHTSCLGQVAKTIKQIRHILILGQVAEIATWVGSRNCYLRLQKLLPEPGSRNCYLRNSYLIPPGMSINSYLTKLIPGKLIPHT